VVNIQTSKGSSGAQLRKSMRVKAGLHQVIEVYMDRTKGKILFRRVTGRKKGEARLGCEDDGWDEGL
jgi:hypothetical protein